MRMDLEMKNTSNSDCTHCTIVVSLEMSDEPKMLALLESYTHDNPKEIAQQLADDFRKRRIEKNLTREQIAEKSGVAMSNIIRFEQKGLISLKHLISLVMALQYTAEIKNIFSEPKYATMEELLQIRKNMGKKRAHRG